MARKFCKKTLLCLTGSETPQYEDQWPTTVRKRDILLHRVRRKKHVLSQEDHKHIERILKSGEGVVPLVLSCLQASNFDLVREIYKKHKDIIDKDESFYEGMSSLIERGYLEILPHLGIFSLTNGQLNAVFLLYFKYVIGMLRIGWKDKLLIFLDCCSRMKVDVPLDVLDGWNYDRLIWFFRYFVNLGFRLCPNIFYEFISKVGQERCCIELMKIWMEIVEDEPSRMKVYSYVRNAFLESIIEDIPLPQKFLLKVPRSSRVGQCIGEMLGHEWPVLLYLPDVVVNNRGRLGVERVLYFIDIAHIVIQKYSVCLPKVRERVKDECKNIWKYLIRHRIDVIPRSAAFVRKMVDFFIEMQVMSQVELDNYIKFLYLDKDTMSSPYYDDFVSSFPVDDEFRKTIPCRLFDKFLLGGKLPTFTVVKSFSREFIDYLEEVTSIVERIQTPYRVFRLNLVEKFPDIQATTSSEFESLPKEKCTKFLSQWIPGSQNCDLDINIGSYSMREFSESWIRWHYHVFKSFMLATHYWEMRSDFQFFSDMKTHNPSRRFLLELGKPCEFWGHANLPPHIWDHIASFIPHFDFRIYHLVKNFCTDKRMNIWMQINIQYDTAKRCCNWHDSYD